MDVRQWIIFIACYIIKAALCMNTSKWFNIHPDRKVADSAIVSTLEVISGRQCAAKCNKIVDCLEFSTTPVASGKLLCELSSSSSVLTNTTNVDSDSTLYEMKWLCWKKSCYYVDYVNTKNYEDSRSGCEDMGAHLLALETQEEIDFIKDMLNDVPGTVPGTWTWRWSGEPVTVSMWSNADPNMASHTVGTMSTTVGGWWDIGASYKVTFICEKNW